MAKVIATDTSIGASLVVRPQLDPCHETNPVVVDNEPVSRSTAVSEPGAPLVNIHEADLRLTKRYETKLTVNRSLDRALVSYQASKGEIESRWYKYKEGFSSALVRYVCDEVGVSGGHVLDPFAGSGTTLFVASELGIDATGIELLPSSVESIEVRRLLLDSSRQRVADALRAFGQSRVWELSGPEQTFPHVRITARAFSHETERLLGRYLFQVDRTPDPVLARVLRFAALCILESVSFTRKDGQYLRWDYRSGKQYGGSKRFDKGYIRGFSEAICGKLEEMSADLCAGESNGPTLFDFLISPRQRGRIDVISGSCLDVLPTLGAGSYDGLITSPPYCNRYDYTRTYALELAMLGVGEEGLRRLRQTMLSCTVENRDKEGLTDRYPKYRYERAVSAWSSQELLQMVLSYLETCRLDGTINNAGIPRMVRNYFLEMALVIFESARVLKPGAPLVMVNDNVRYQGAHLPVDLILSDFAVQAGFEVEKIWVLPRGKGNSSQQMGAHGRTELRKCVYVWRRLRDPECA